MNRIYQQNFKGEKLIRKNVFDINVLLIEGEITKNNKLWTGLCHSQ